MKSGRRIAFEYLGLGVLCLIVACSASLGFEDMRYAAAAGSHWRPLDDFGKIVGSVWFAALFHLLLPTGWIFWVGFGFAIKKKVAWLFIASAVPALVVGWLWPRGYWAFMSV